MGGLSDAAAVRRQEQSAAAKALGVAETVALGYEDGRLKASESPRELWLFDCQEPDHVVDVTKGFAQKLESLRAHASQSTAGGGLLAAAERVGAAIGSPDRPAEAFVRLFLGVRCCSLSKWRSSDLRSTWPTARRFGSSVFPIRPGWR